MSFGTLLNKKATLQRRTETQGAGGEVSNTWTNYATNISCRLEPKSGAGSQEVLTAEGKMVKASHTLYMTPRTVGEKNNRAVIDSKIYDILTVEDGGGHGHHLEILVRRTFGG